MNGGEVSPSAVAAMPQGAGAGARVAVVGSGISGLAAAYAMRERHDVHVFEAADRIGGHTHTHDIEHEGERLAVDTGFIVFNRRTYPGFCALLDELGVAAQASDMGFSVRCERTGLEYAGKNLNTLFAQRSNVLRPSFHRMIREILRFHREAPALLQRPVTDSMTLAEFLAEGGYADSFVSRYLIPMGAAIWSARPAAMLEFPARYFVQFFHNHGMLTVEDRPTWYVVRGGSSSYLSPLVAALPHPVRCSTPVREIRRRPDGVELTLGLTAKNAVRERFDHVVLATHSDTALRMLADPSEAEREILGAIPYQSNEAVLHTDARLMPRRRRAWAAWNYHLGHTETDRVAVTYNMNILQGFASETQFCVTLNRTAGIAPESVLARMSYDHPVYTPAGIRAQARRAEISDPARRTLFAGAYWGFGFHEDGVQSGLAAARQLGAVWSGS